MKDARLGDTVRFLGSKGIHAFLLIFVTETLLGATTLSISFLLRGVLDGVMKQDRQLLERSLLFLLPGTIFLGFILWPLLKRFSVRYTYGVLKELRRQFYGHAVNIKMEALSSWHSGNFISNLTHDLSEVESLFTSKLSNFLQQLVVGIIASFAVAMIDWRIFLNAVFWGGLNLTAISLSKKMKVYATATQEQRARITELYRDINQGISIIKVFKGSHRIFQRYREELQKLTDLSLKQEKMTWLFSTFIGLNNVARDLSFLMIAAFISRVSFGSLLALMNLSSWINSSMGLFGQSLLSVQTSLAGIQRFSKTFELEEEKAEEASEPFSKSKEAADVITFANVSFTYPEGKRALNNVNLSIGENEYIGIVGAVGSGKSTLLKMLMGLQEPDEGEVMVLGNNTRSCSLQGLREQIAYVDQEAVLFAGTLHQNITCWREDCTRDEVERAARMARIHEIIMDLPKGYDTDIGEAGSRLSGGERKRVALARALLKDAPILVLDEVTSALDNITEAGIREALNELKGKKTILVIAHRLSSIMDVDRVIVIRDGRLPPLL